MANSRYENLKEMERQLLYELEKVRELLAMYEPTPAQTPAEPKREKVGKEVIKPEGISKGDLSWETYIQKVLIELGGKSKTAAVIAYAIKANPKIHQETITDAVRGKLSKLYRLGVIGANKPTLKKDGYEFYIKSVTNDAQ